MPVGLTFARIEVEVDFVRGPWATTAPSTGGISNVFWLHRGMAGNHWLNNMVGYLNFKGHGKIEVSTNLGITDPAIWNQALNKSLSTTEGMKYHATYVYDGAGKKMWFRILQDQNELVYREGVPLLDTIDAQDSWKPPPQGKPGFFIVIGNEAWDGSGGPEVPTYDWVYTNLVVRFFPACQGT